MLTKNKQSSSTKKNTRELKNWNR